jgi:hypothetical protein
MAAPGIDFQKIRSHGGSQDHGFEELVCQIASLEPRPMSDAFYRKGKRADAGVECFIKHANGAETGWQAKWFWKFEANQISQLDESIKQALLKHPKLKKYVVCLPVDLRDARVGKAQTESERWNAWVKKWKTNARKSGRTISIELWSASSLIQRLTQSDPLYAGRVRYWFDSTVLDNVWFKQRFEEARASLGERYTPATNVELPIRRVLLAFGRDRAVQQEVDNWQSKLEELRYRAVDSLDRRVSGDKKSLIRTLEETTRQFAASLSSSSAEPDTHFPLDDWWEKAERAGQATYECLKMMWDRESSDKTDEKDSNRDTQYAIHILQQLSSFVHEFKDTLQDDRWRIVNARRLLIYGDAGVGKSHLFGDAVEHWIVGKKPALLILGSAFTDGDPWSQILNQLGLQSLDRDTFLGAMDAAAQAAGTRAVLLIDAINERNGLEVWPSRLPAFLKSIERFPRLAIGLSCRSSYLPFLIDQSLDETQLPRIEHVGFAGRAGEAAQVYLDRRGIVRMAAPNLLPEFENPLFLKTCCDYLQKEGLTEFLRGLRGVTMIFEFYFTAVARQIERKLKLDPNQNIVARAISAIAAAGDQSERGYIAKDGAYTALEAILPSQGYYERSLLSQLVSEGVLSIEPVRVQNGTSQDYVRFTFERYSDHRIAAHLLDKHLDATNPSASFAAGTFLHAYVTDQRAYRKIGIVEALAVQLSERTNLELPDVLPPHSAVHRAFLRSVLWRNQKCFRSRTLELLRDLSRYTGEDEAMRILIAVATEPENEFNALYLHERLWARAMPKRDQIWSTYLARHGDSDGSPIQTLITWIAHNGLLPMEETRAELAAITLSWFFTTSHRAIRDQATKALSTLLAVRLPLATKLIQRFAKVDDPYVLERVFAACYGAAMQGLRPDDLGELAETAFENIFAVAEPIAHVLIRDYARGLVELALVRGVLPDSVDITRARPPYRSSWPLRDVSAKIIDKYKDNYDSGQSRDAIVGSCVNDGDFARYEIDPAVGHWSSLPISVAGKSQQQFFEDWKERALSAKPKAKTALTMLIEAFDKIRAEQEKIPTQFFTVRFIESKNETGAKSKNSIDSAWKRTERTLAKREAELGSALGKKWWEEYCLYARSYIQRDIYALTTRHFWPPSFNSNLVRRWVCKRAHDLGWTVKRFSKFDRQVRDNSRHDHRTERMGKKYQWIALHEALAHLADNAAFKGSHGEALRKFEGPWETSTRDIDPSLLANESYDEQWRQWNPTWWMPAAISLNPVSPEERLLWVGGDADFPNDSSLFTVTDPQGEKWFVVDEFVSWSQWGRDRGEKTLERTAWLSMNCLLVRTVDRAKLIEALSGRIIRSSHDLPSLEVTHGYLGEYCWHPVSEQSDGWAKTDLFHKIPVTTQSLDTEYSAKQCEFDYSLGESFRFKLPAPGLLKGLNLHLSSGKNVSYADPTGKVLFFDPSTKEEGPSAALVNCGALLEFLKREKLEAVWLVTCSKEAFGGRAHHRGWGGQRQKTSIYWMTTTGVQLKQHEERERPSSDQLREYLGKNGPTVPPKRSAARDLQKGPRRANSPKKQKESKKGRTGLRSRPKG